MTSAIGAILLISGVVTAGAGLAALLSPRWLLRTVFGVNEASGALEFFARHWGALIFAIGALVVYSAYAVPVRPAVLAAAAFEKFAIVGLVFLGPLRRTRLMTAAAAMDGLFAILYVVYLVA